MGKISSFKRVLSVLLAMVLLLSSMAVAGVSAATGQAYHYTFDEVYGGKKYATDYYVYNSGMQMHTNNNIMDDAGVRTEFVQEGENGSNAIKMMYTANAENTATQQYASFSVPNNTGAKVDGRNNNQTAHAVANRAYRITVKYKVNACPTPAALYFAIGMGALGGNPLALASFYPVKIMDITTTTDGWVTASAAVVAAVKNGIYFVLDTPDDTNRAGTEVLIDNIDIVPIDVSTISFDSDGGTEVAPFYGEWDTAITYPADPVKEGYAFDGWYQTNGSDKPVNFPHSDLQLVAKWRDLATWSFESEEIGAQLSLDANYPAKVTDAQKYSGSKSLAVESKNKTAVARAQVAVYDGVGKRVAMEKGKNYRLSFWAYVPDTATAEINYWLTATDDEAAYTDSAQKDAEKIYEASAVGVTKGAWQEITAVIEDAAVSGNVRFGITLNSTTPATFYVDDINIKEIIPTQPDEGTWSFEDEANNTVLDLNTTTTEVMTVTNELAHAGLHSVRVDSNANGDACPQLMVKDEDGDQITVEAGRDYFISFWTMVPAGGFTSDFNYWFTASTDANCYTSSYSKTPYVIAEGIAAQSAENGQWQRITTYIEDCKLDGMLRLGVSADAADSQPVVFYLDDILVQEIEDGANVVQDFDGYALEQKLSLNSDDKTTITVSDDVAYSGTHSAMISSNTKAGNARPQMMVKDGLDRQITVYKGRKYQVTFKVYIPATQQDYGLSYWLAAYEDDTCFSDSGVSKDTCQIASVAVEPDLRTKGVWSDVVIEISNCAYSGKLRLGITGDWGMAHKFYIDDLTVTEEVIEPDLYADSFERYDVDKVLDINTDASSITVTKDDSHAGFYSAKVVTTGNSVYDAPQLMVNDFRTRNISVTKGNKYNISFWVLLPTTAADHNVQFWLAAVDNDTAFTDATKTNIIYAPETVTIAEKGAWQNVVLSIDSCPFSGKLRLGITGDTDAAHIFYIDDILVEERVSTPADPAAMNFENLQPDQTININTINNHNLGVSTVTIVDTEAYTGSQSALFQAFTNGGDERAQINVTDGAGNQVKVEQGKDYILSFWVKVPTTEDYFSFSYWAAAVPDDMLNTQFRQNESNGPKKNNYVIGEVSFATQPTPGSWQLIKLPISDCKHAGNLRVGITHGNATPFVAKFYIDDIIITPPDYVTVKFDTNGSEDKYDDVTIISDTLVPFEGVDPYRYGYDFMGWYTSKDFAKDSYIDIKTQTIIGKTGDVVTLYACWKEWEEEKAEYQEKVDEYVTEYYTEKVWVGDKNLPKPIETGNAPIVNDAAPIQVTPDPIVIDSDGVPPWLIVVIIVCAVAVVGGGAAIAAILLKKNKKA